MRTTTAAVSLPLAALLLAGCGADPAADRREQVAGITDAANAGDAAAVRSRADALLGMLSRQVERQELASDEAERLTALVQAVRTGADVIDDELIERRRAEAEAEAERQRLEEERRQLEEDRKKAEEERRQLEEDRKKADEERKKAEEEGKDGKGDKDDD